MIYDKITNNFKNKLIKSVFCFDAFKSITYYRGLKNTKIKEVF